MTEIVDLFRTLTYGVYVIGVARGRRHNAFTAAWVMQVSFDPLLVAVCINPEHASYALLREGRAFSVNVLRAGQLEIARHFGTRSGRAGDKLGTIAWRPARTGSPILVDALAYVECRVTRTVRSGDHRVVLGTVISGAILNGGAMPMTYRETGDMDGSRVLYPAVLPIAAGRAG
ncbi:MAG: hypothetical protein NVS4B3_27200 [Gemmatimonadaceae bacterium]